MATKANIVRGLGFAAELREQTEAALGYYQEASTLLGPLANKAFKYIAPWCEAMEMQGQAQQKLEDYEGAARSMAKSIKAREHMAQTQPSASHAHGLAWAHRKLAEVYRAHAKLGDAFAQAKRGITNRAPRRYH